MHYYGTVTARMMGNAIIETHNDSLAMWLRKQIPRILSTWERRTRRELHSAEHQDSLVLQNAIGVLLHRIADVLSGTKQTKETDEREKQKLKKSSLLHGSGRADLSPYSIEDVISEYHIARETIFDVLEEHRELTRPERNSILNIIEQAVNDAASEFSRTLRGFEQVFVLTLVHDLRGPANNAMLALQHILRDGSHNVESMRTAASIAYDNLRRISEMVTDLLNANRARAGGVLALEYSNVDLAALVEQVRRERGSERLHVEITGDRPILGQWNGDGLRRVIENLVDNAFKFGFPDTPVTVTLGQTGSEAILAVHNEGDPIPDRDRDRLFKEFSRGPWPKGKGGWGIGLVLVKGMIDAHGGEIRIESEEGIGTTFIVRLPK